MRILWIVLVGLLGVEQESVGSSATPPYASTEVTIRGKALTLEAAIAACGLSVQADPEQAGRQVVIVNEQGTMIPLLADVASRALFLDDRLRNRPLELKGREYRGLPFIQVVSFRVEHDGEFRTPEYYCNICTISVRYPQICPCCQGPMELRMKPRTP